MGSLYDLFDSGLMARKVLSHNRQQVDGLEAPRNSLDLPLESSYGLYAARDNIWYGYSSPTDSHGEEDYFYPKAPMKKLINDEISRRPKYKPSVVARLMGVDMMPLDLKKEAPTSGKLMEENLIASSFNHFSASNIPQQQQQQEFRKLREHPQEEELKKFKKEFEAWQASRFKQCSIQLIAQEELNREKMLLYANNSRGLERPRDLVDSLKSRKNCSYQQTHEIDSSPSRIVILRAGPDGTFTNEDSWSSSPSTSEEQSKIEDFLEEVKERLKSEIQGKSSKRCYTVRGGGIETPYWEKTPEPREIAQSVSRHVRESVVNRDLETNLLRSESTRSYRSEFRTGSPEFMNRDTRRFLAERLRNVLKGEAKVVPKHVRSKSRLSISDNDGSKFAPQSRDTLKESNYTNEINKEESNRSFRREEEQSPRNLVRSLSAPVSGTSFGKLLLEDRHVVTGAHLMRKHEATKKQKKEKFNNIKEKVSSFRYSWTLRGKLFRKRIKSVSERDQSLKDIAIEPIKTMGFYDTHENSTEVPPSPASVCSSIRDELWRPADFPSPASSLGGYQLENGDVSHAFEDITSNLNELRRKINKLEGSVSNTTSNRQSPTEFEPDIEDETEAYVRDLLVASGLYYGSFGGTLSKWDPLGKPISSQVYEEVEEVNGNKGHGEKLNHKMILDLLNEKIPMILRQPENKSKYMEKAVGPFFKPPRGRKLLSLIWSMIREYVQPPTDDRGHYSLDNMLAGDLNSEAWSRLIEDDCMNVLGMEIECRIIGDLIAEIAEDM